MTSARNTFSQMWPLLLAVNLFLVFPVANGDLVFHFPKLIFLGGLVLCYGLFVANKRHNLTYRGPRTAVWLAGGYLVAGLLSNTALSSLPGITLLGWPGWNSGYFFHALLPIIILLSAVIGSSNEKMTGSAVRILFYSSVLMVAICVLEVLGFNPVLGNSFLKLLDPNTGVINASYPIATVGNSGVVAGFWLLVAPLPLLLPAGRRQTLWHAVNALGIATTHSKTVLLIYLVFLIGITILNKALFYRNILFALCAACTYQAILPANAFLAAHGYATERNAKAKTLDPSSYNGSFSNRLLIYTSVFRMWQDRPLTGWGYETMQMKFYDYLTQPEYQTFIQPVMNPKPNQTVRRFGAMHVLVDKAKPNVAKKMQYFDIVKPHNAYLEELYSNGLLAFGLLVAFYGSILVYIWKYRTRISLILLTSGVLYGVYLNMWFTNMAITPLACLLLGLALANTRTAKAEARVLA